MPDVVMPRLSDSMEEGTILRWLKAPGDAVTKGDELAEIETDKATMTYEAEADGVFEAVAGEGDTLPVGAVIARLGDGVAGTAAPPPAEPATSAPAPASSPGNGATAENVKASPIARRVAQERGIDLAAVKGSGPGGRIVRADVEPAAEKPAAPAPATATPVAERGTAKGDVRVEELTRTQQVVARRMAESKATVPDFTIQTEADMERCVQLRADLRQVAGPDGVVPSFNDMVVKAAALALREFPRANASYRDGRFELYSRVNVGIAVAAQDSLVVPTIFDADERKLGDIALESRRLAARVRDGSVTPPELSGGTFTVSNLGMYGITEFVAVINPPQAAILAVGAMEQKPVVHEGEIVARHRMALTLVCDHRILYGADAAQFLARIRALLEQPLAMAL